MALIQHLLCPVCGTMRPVSKFGQEVPLAAAVCSIGGRGSAQWTPRRPMTEEEARQLLQLLENAAARVRAALAGE